MLTWKFIHDRVPSELSFKVRSFFSSCLPWFVDKPDPNMRLLRAFVDERHYSYDLYAPILGAPFSKLLPILDKFPEESSLCQEIAGQITPAQFRSAMSFVASAKRVEEKSAEAQPSKSTWYERLKKKFFGESASEVVQVKPKEHKSTPVKQLSHLSIQSKIPDVNYLHKLFFENETLRDELKNYFAKSSLAENVTFLKAVLDKNLVANPLALLQRLVNYMPCKQHLEFVNGLIAQTGEFKHRHFPSFRRAILQGKLEFFTSEQTPFVANRAHSFLDKFANNLSLGLENEENLKLTVEAVDKLAITFPQDFLLGAVNKLINLCGDFVQAAIDKRPILTKPKTRDIDTFYNSCLRFTRGEKLIPGYTASQELEYLISRLNDIDKDAVSALEWMKLMLTLHKFKETSGLSAREGIKKDVENKQAQAGLYRDDQVKELKERLFLGVSDVHIQYLRELHPDWTLEYTEEHYRKLNANIKYGVVKQDARSALIGRASTEDQRYSAVGRFGMA